MGKRKHLRCFGIFAVDKYQRSQGIGERESPEFFWGKRSVCIATGNTAYHDHYTKGISLLDELA